MVICVGSGDVWVGEHRGFVQPMTQVEPILRYVKDRIGQAGENLGGGKRQPLQDFIFAPQ
jgi:hypothetical protein